MAKKIQFLNKIIALIWLLLILFNSTFVPILKAIETEDPEPDIEIINENEANVENELEAEAETGNEEVTGNAGDVDVSSEDAEAVVDLVNKTNENITEVEVECTTDCEPDPEELEPEFNVVVESSNSAQVKNDLEGSALSGGNEVVQNAGDATVESGDAVAAALLENSVNTNKTGITEVAPCEDCEITAGAEVDVLVENENVTEAINEVNLEATSGANLVKLNAGDAEISSGNAIAQANLLNFINTNLTGSNILSEVVNVIGDLIEDVNLLESFLNLLGSEEPLGSEDSGSLTVTNINEGTLINNIEVEAYSGQNDVLSNAGDATIETGEASALVNLINFLNTNLIGTSWFFNITNIFGDFLGDIILPGEGSGPSSSGSVPTCSETELEVENNNVAEVENVIETEALAGNNVVEQNAGDVAVENGPAFSDSNLVEQTNTNRVSESWVFLIINKVGDWVGSIINGPEEGESSTNDHLIYDYSLEDDCEECPVSGCDSVFNPPLLAVSNNNKAVLQNNVSVKASTGQNNVIGNAGDASIVSGPAAALANVINFVNTNIIGSNWLFGLINIFGDWEGDLVFAYPDLTISKTDHKETAELGETLTYEISYRNLGQMRAKNVYIFDTLPEEVTYVSDNFGIAPSVLGQTYTWFIGDVEAGASGTFEVTVTVNSDLGLGTHYLDNTVLIDTCSRESDTSNNSGSDRTTVEVYPDLEVSKDDGQGTADPGDELTYTIDYKNIGNFAAENVTLIDELPNHVSLVSGVVSWDLGTLDPGESGSVTLTVKVDSTLPVGTTTLMNTVEISTSTEEPNKNNNSDSDETSVYFAKVGGPNLVIQKSNDKEVVALGGLISFTITIVNKGDTMAREVIVFDTLKDPRGNEVSSQSWDLGEVLPDEEIIIEYTLKVSSDAPLGLYENHTKVEGKNLGGEKIDFGEASSVFNLIAGVAIAAPGPEVGEVLGVALPVTGNDDSWMLILAAICLLLAGILLKSFNTRLVRAKLLREAPYRAKILLGVIVILVCWISQTIGALNLVYGKIRRS